ncbi:MAG: hypothetical protein H6728_16870, partial [Myxococcales bacterium]|nr:hypothetical protein [Myxococcales bacterium]
STEKSESNAESVSEPLPETVAEPSPEPVVEPTPEPVAEPKPEGACTPGESRACYTGPAGTEGVGACKGGFQSCDQSGVWGACQGEVLPGTAEICGNQIDDNCDGKTDAEDTAACSCNPGQTQDCYSGPAGTEGVGVCKKGTQTCDANSTWGACQGEVLPGTTEICGNKLDDNCDGMTDTADTAACECDPNDTRACYTGPSGTDGVGECKAGVETCGADGKWGTCQGDVLPSQEVCDGKDNNCDGKVDEEDPSAPHCPAGQRCDGGKCTCDATSCTTGCCDAMGACATPSNAQCGTGGAACSACAQGTTCDAGKCVCNATSCPNGCCDSQGQCQAGNSNASCGKNGVACAACPSGQACDPQSQVCGCGPNTCATGCCNANGQCTTSVVSACGVGGNACLACDTKFANVCDNGACKCGSGAACVAGQACVNNQCVCNATSCPNGCCDGNKCVSPRTVALCGAAGAACKACTAKVANACNASGACACGAGAACTGEASCTNGSCVCTPIQVSNVQINGTAYSTTPISVVRGGTFSVKLDYKITQVAGCPGCIDQLVVGIYTKGYGPSAASACVYNGQPASCPSATSGTSTVSIDTPLTPGTYEIRAHRDLQFNCNDALNGFNRQSDLSNAMIIATITVTEAPACQGFTALLSNVKLNGQGNEVTVAPGANVTFSANYKFTQLPGCPACFAQIVAGYEPFIGGGGAPTKMDCLYNGGPGTCPSSSSGSKSLTFKAPTTPGIYHIRHRQDLQFTCTNAGYGAVGRTATVGVLRVQ